MQQFWIVGKMDTRPISPWICGFVASCYTAAGGQCGITAWFSIATVNCGDIEHVTLIKTFSDVAAVQRPPGCEVTGGIQLSIQDFN